MFKGIEKLTKDEFKVGMTVFVPDFSSVTSPCVITELRKDGFMAKRLHNDKEDYQEYSNYRGDPEWIDLDKLIKLRKEDD